MVELGHAQTGNREQHMTASEQRLYAQREVLSHDLEKKNPLRRFVTRRSIRHLDNQIGIKAQERDNEITTFQAVKDSEAAQKFCSGTVERAKEMDLDELASVLERRWSLTAENMWSAQKEHQGGTVVDALQHVALAIAAKDSYKEKVCVTSSAPYDWKPESYMKRGVVFDPDQHVPGPDITQMMQILSLIGEEKQIEQIPEIPQEGLGEPHLHRRRFSLRSYPGVELELAIKSPYMTGTALAEEIVPGRIDLEVSKQMPQVKK